MDAVCDGSFDPSQTGLYCITHCTKGVAGHTTSQFTVKPRNCRDTVTDMLTSIRIRTVYVGLPNPVHLIHSVVSRNTG